MAEDTTPEFILEPIKISDLRLDARYQRALDLDDVDAIVRDYRPEQFQPITVGMRPDNSFHIVDGQHRVAAARRMGWSEVPCMVFLSDGFEHEAAVFERLQTHRAALTVGQRWKARLARKEPKAVAINEIVSALGLQLTEGATTPTRFGAYVACERAYERGNLRDTLTAIVQAWNYDPTGFRAVFVNWVSSSLAALKAQGGDTLDMSRAVAALAKITPAGFLRETPLVADASAAFLRRLTDNYNQGRRSGLIKIDDPGALLRSERTRRGAIRPERLAKFKENVGKGIHALPPDKKAEAYKKSGATRSAKVAAAKAALAEEAVLYRYRGGA